MGEDMEDGGGTLGEMSGSGAETVDIGRMPFSGRDCGEPEFKRSA